MNNKPLLSLPPEVTENKNNLSEPPESRPRTREDFYKFCTTVLDYENYEAIRDEENRNESNASPPLDSSGSSVNSESTNSGRKGTKNSDDDDEDSDLVTCFCGKPFAGRPMIECLECLTWIHLSCAKIKKNNIPEVFLCSLCKKKNISAAPSSPPDKNVKRPRKNL